MTRTKSLTTPTPERSRFPDGHVGKHLGVELDVTAVEGLAHVPSVVAVLGSSSVNTYRKIKNRGFYYKVFNSREWC